jgi:tetratricopeptide (TPR) repeat protein
MANKKHDKTDEQLLAVEEALSKSEKFIEDNQNRILLAIGIVVVIVLGYFGAQRFIIEPKEKEAQEAIFMAQTWYEQDSLDLALEGDGNFMGLLDVADDYSSTPAGNLANFYIGMSYLKKGQFEDAIDYLGKFGSDDLHVSMLAKAGIGDAHMELGDNAKAAGIYVEAANMNDNKFLTPALLQKAGIAYELDGKTDKANEIYHTIKSEYPFSPEGRDIDRYIGRTEK